MKQMVNRILQNSYFITRNINHKSLYSLAAGFTARSICSVIMLPVTMIKTRYELTLSSSLIVWNIIRQ